VSPVGVDGPTASRAKVGLSKRQQRTVRMKFRRIAIDISKHVFTLHGVDDQECPVLRRDLKRAEVEAFFGKLESTEVVWRRAVARIIGAVCWLGWAIRCA
jgi:hypothetical protein